LNMIPLFSTWLDPPHLWDARWVVIRGLVEGVKMVGFVCVLARILIHSIERRILEMTKPDITALLFLLLMAPVTAGSVLRSLGGPRMSCDWMLSTYAYAAAEATVNIAMYLIQGCKLVLTLFIVLGDGVLALGVALKGHLHAMNAAASAEGGSLGRGRDLAPPPYTRYSFTSSYSRYCCDVPVDVDHI